jgi:hypothetical protein
MFPLDELIDLLELIINLLKDSFILIVQHLLIFFHLHVHVLYPL